MRASQPALLAAGRVITELRDQMVVQWADWLGDRITAAPTIPRPTVEREFRLLLDVISEMVGRKAGFFELFGLEHASGLIRTYIAEAQAVESLDDLRRLTDAALAYANRVHVWLDAAFPWGVCTGFMRPGYGTRNAEGLEQGGRQ